MGPTRTRERALNDYTTGAQVDHWWEECMKWHRVGALLFGLFEHEEVVRVRFGVPEGRRAVGAIALGHPAPDRPSGSASRVRPPLDAVIHRGRW